MTEDSVGNIIDDHGITYYVDENGVLTDKRVFHPIKQLIDHDKPAYLVEILLKIGKVDPNFYDGYWHSLMCATENLEIFELLLQYGANTEIGTACHGPWITYLSTFVYESNLELVKLLLKYNANPYITNTFGNANVLYWCGKCDYGNRENDVEIRRLILKRMKSLNHNVNFDEINEVSDESDNDDDILAYIQPLSKSTLLG